MAKSHLLNARLTLPVLLLLCYSLRPSSSTSSTPAAAPLAPAKAAFFNDYGFTWGDEIVQDDGTAILSIQNKDKRGGGWTSKQPWIHGTFSALIKLPAGPSCGVVTAFYLTSEWNTSWPADLHDEIDFEMLGDENTGEIQLQTNYFVGGKGGHEERLKLWFDPTLDFHEYKFQINKESVRWYVDGILVREITTMTECGLPKTSQFLVASIWDGAFWVPCTLGRQERTLDYSKGPFTAYFKNVSMTACYWRQQVDKDPPSCTDPKNIYPWDERPGEGDRKVMKHLQDHYLVYSWETWNTTGGLVKVEAPEERTSYDMFEFAGEEGGKYIRGVGRLRDSHEH